MSTNPFYQSWNKGWSFLFFLEGGIAKIEAKGLGVSLIANIEKGETPNESADRLIFREQRRRKSLHNSWIKSLKTK